LERAKSQAVALDLLKAACLPDSTVDARMKESCSPQYWRDLNPQMSVSEKCDFDILESSPLNASQIAEQVKNLNEEGYFRTPHALTNVAQLRGCIETLREAGWPPVFSFVYDQFWAIFRIPTLCAILESYLGRKYDQNKNIWTYYVAAQAGGWGPHMDSPLGRSAVTIWIPLTDTNENNACMYVVRHTSMPVSQPPNFAEWTNVAKPELVQVLQGAQALPAQAGSLLGWHHQLLHWGSFSKVGEKPRISVATEFQRHDITRSPLLFGQATFPSFIERLRCIGSALQQYSKFELSIIRYEALAAKLSVLP
jgi:Phytanoyl-CoA dioxygenase (PhyH)